MKRAAIITGGTADMSFAIAVFLLSFFRENPDMDVDVVIFQNGISEKDRKVLEAIHPCIFKEYRSPFDMDVLRKIGTMHRFTPFVFCKYECLKLLEEYRTVVWFDYDMVVTGNLEELFVPVKGGNRLMLTRTLGECIRKDVVESDLIKYEAKVGVHSSVMAFYDNLPDYIKMYNWCIEMTKRYAGSLKLPEQVIFSLLIHKFHLPVYPLPFQLYSPHPVLHRGNPWDIYVKIWHSYGRKKFWNGIQFDIWNKYYSDYLKICEQEGSR